MADTGMPWRAAAARSSTSESRRPLACWSLLTSFIPGMRLNAASTLGSQVRSAPRSLACRVYSYRAADGRPPARMSCTGNMKVCAPGTADSALRNCSMMVCTPGRSPIGLSCMNMKPLLAVPPPVKASTFWTPSFLRTMATMRSSFWLISWNEIDWSACTEPTSSPVSWVGKNPLGTMAYR
ncbi:hypothetical protein GALL_524020 [mine drainage metagenome]|uniref:Uncharacterized protein n=1 Tax=mine drainage metagenome TaxID=410659 RepID=A0A1J5PET9_9ZZZZ